LHRRTDLHEKLEPLWIREPVLVAERIQGQSFDQLHDKVGLSFIGASTIKQSGDVGMVETGQNLTFVLEALNDETRIVPCSNQFDCNLLLVLVVCAKGSIDLTHASDADQPSNLVGAHALALKLCLSILWWNDRSGGGRRYFGNRGHLVSVRESAV